MAVTLIVEDGSQVPNSNVYDSLANVKTYFGNIDDPVFTNTPSTGYPGYTDEQLSAAMVRACRYLDAVYQLAWKGRKISYTQSMTWPRMGVVVSVSPSGIEFPILTTEGFLIPTNSVPNPVKQAFYELAKRALTDDLQPDVAAGQGGMILSQRVGDLAVTYMSGNNKYKRYRYVDSILQDLLWSSAGNVELVRG